MDITYHIPALLHESVNGLNIQPDGIYVDATFGGGGHSQEILHRMHSTGGNGKLFSFDQDMDAYRNQQQHNSPILHDSHWQFIHGNFRYIKNFLDYYDVHSIDGILADLGVSFHHFDESSRGFSFRWEGPLDMRMNRDGGKSAADIVNSYTEEELARVIYMYGELRNSRSLARAIVHKREQISITQMEQLVNAVPQLQKKDLARLCQALRIEVNDELGALRDMLFASQQLLRSGGRIVILTYHSLEDRIVKNFLRSGHLDGTIEKDFYGNIRTPYALIEKGKMASEEEVIMNPRARSAKLRIAEKK